MSGILVICLTNQSLLVDSASYQHGKSPLALSCLLLRFASHPLSFLLSQGLSFTFAFAFHLHSPPSLFKPLLLLSPFPVETPLPATLLWHHRLLVSCLKGRVVLTHFQHWVSQLVPHSLTHHTTFITVSMTLAK